MKVDRELADVAQGRDRELAELGQRLVRPGRIGQRLESAETEEDRRERLPRLVVQLPREPAPLELLRRDDAPEGIPRHAFGEVDCDGRAAGEGLGEAKVVVGEAAVRDRPPCRVRRARRSRGPGDERHPEPRASRRDGA